MFRKNLLVVLGVVLSFAAFGASAQDKLFKLSFDVSHMGKAVGSPIVVVREGVPGSMEVSGPDGYKMTFTATEAGSGKIKIATTFSSAQGSSSPTVIVKDGQAGSISDGRFEFKFVATRQSS